MKNLFFLFLVLVSTCTLQATELKQTKTQTGFIQNNGQWNSDVLFLARTKGMNAWITKQGIRYDFHTVTYKPSSKLPTLLSNENSKHEGRVRGSVIDMKCVGSNVSNDNPNGLQKTYYNYIIGQDKSKWASNVPVYNEIIRKEVYNGIDERLYFDGNYLRYDYIIAPNGNPLDIQLSFNGSKGININSDGELVIKTSIGDVVQQKLFAYQVIGNEKKQVECSFISKPGGKIGFTLENYDHSKPLTIDPLVYSTFLGGADTDYGIKVVLDLASNVIATGHTRSANFPTQIGSYDRTIDGERDAYVAKFNQDLSDLIFCTYYGGTRDDFVKSCAVDEAGYVVVCGYTFSNNLPCNTPDYDPTYNGGGDGYIAKISYSGAALVYGTYLGGTGADAVNDVVLTPFAADAIVVGTTNSTDFPVTAGAYKTTNKWLNDGFVTKMNVSGSGLVFSTLLGRDSTADECNGVALDRNGNAIVVGSTINGEFTPTGFPPLIRAKNSFPTSGSAFRKTNNNLTTIDGFLAKLGIGGNTIEYSTLIGGGGNDICLSVDVDKQGIAAVCGITTSNTDFNPTVFDQSFGGGSEGFVMRLGTTGGMYYSSYLGGSADEDVPNCIKYYDATGAVVVSGYTLSTDFPTGKIMDFNYHGGKEGFIIQLNSAGNLCNYSAYVGGATDDLIFGMAVSNIGNVYITGNTYSSNFPTTANAKFKEFNGSVDAFVTVINTCSVNLQSPKDTLVCPGKPLTLTNNATGTGNVRYNWVDVVKGVTVGTEASVTVIPDAPNVYSLTVTDDNCSKTISYTVTTKPLPTISTIEERKTCVGTSLNLSATADPSSTIEWYDAIDATISIGKGNTYSTAPLKNSVVLYVESTDTSTKCTSGRKPIKITVVPPPNAPFLDNASLCADNSATLTAIFPSDVNFKWYDSLTGGKLLQVGRTFTTPKVLKTTIFYIESLDTTTNCISAKRTAVTVTVLPSPNPMILGQNAACVNTTGLVYAVASNPKREYTWTITPNGTITGGLGTNQITVSWNAVGAGIISLKEKDLTSGCSKDVTYNVMVSNELSSTIAEIGSTKLCTGDSVVLDAGAGYTSYKWSNGETSQTITVKTAGEFSVAVQDAGGCKGNSNKVTVTLSPRPDPQIVGQKSTCVNGNPLQYSVTPIAINSYTWEVSPEGTIASGQGSSSITVNWTSAGSGWVKVTESSTNCSTANTMAVTISTSLSTTITAIGKTALCEGESVVLDAGNFAKYTWSTGETSRTITVTKAGSYTVDIEDAGGCKGSSQPIVITVSPLPVPTITVLGKTTLCEGESVDLIAGVFSSYLWSNGATSKNITVNTAGKYSVTVTNSSGCVGTSADVVVTVNPLPLIPIISQKGDDSLVVSPFDVNSTYAWKLNGADIGLSSNVIFASTDGSYTVEVTNANGCKNISQPFTYLKPSSAVLTVAISPSMISASAGETVKIPLVITSSKNLTQATASNFTAEVSVDQSVLVQNNGTSTIDNLNRRVVAISGTRKDGNDTLAIIEMKAGLGEIETSPIILKSMVFQSGKAQVTTKDGEFHLTGICKEGSTRLYKSGAVLSLFTYPNPANDVLNLDVTVAEAGRHRITLTNTLGEEVAELYNNSISGSQVITNSLVDIPNGLYFIVLQSPTQKVVHKLYIVK